MKRRNFLIGAGGIAIGGSALLGSGAFSRVESQRMVNIEVATDEDAYLGLAPLDTANSNNYVDFDENGHLYIDVGENPNGGEGVNSDSFTWFDGMFEVCNQGKADANLSHEMPAAVEAGHPSLEDDWTAPDPEYDEPVVALYRIDDEGERHVLEPGDDHELALGECMEVGVRTVTKGIDATVDEPLIDGEIVITADAPEAGQPGDGNDDDDGNF